MLISSKLNSIKGFDEFLDRDIVLGVTQYLDDLWQTRKNVVLENEYKYHWRLYGDNLTIRKPNELKEGDNLIISMPFPYYGDIHPDMKNVLGISYLSINF